ncbi:MAG: hypothetical protein A2X86_21715 [Bdellovibrionales bacterium GWA2_49_15]|nr:MAG: hypothetical protein A2X86_21715 [Bdellovibrionales bacterium GWA2_49_15]HAZ12831.1 hypothetical protein [Bdellovibrionales bacterium]
MKLALILLLLSFSVLARDKGQVGVGLGIGPSMITNPSRLEDPSGVGLAGGFWAKYTLSEKLNLDLSYHRLDFSDITTYTNGVTVGASYLFTTDRKINPFVHLGVGAGTIPHNNRDTNGQVELLSTIGLGVESQLSKNWLATVQADFHAFIPTGENNSQLYALAPLFGITYYWDQALVAAVPCVVEPPVRTVMAGVQRIDTGAVQRIDHDNDGIDDSRDLCPNTQRGDLVDNTGCGKPKKIMPNINIKFFAGKSTISHYYHDQLDKSAALIKKDKKLKIIITGHADTSGKSRINQSLSRARAEAVREYLIKKHRVNPDDIVARAYGTSAPEASNKDPAGRSANRRVEAEFLEVITQ